MVFSRLVSTWFGRTNLKLFLLITLLCFSPIWAYANEANSELSQVLEQCRQRGINALLFPDDVALSELNIESYSISAFEHEYTVWIVTTERQREGIEFGWVSYQTPTNTFCGSYKTKDTYLEEKNLLCLEEELGCYHFWSPETKAEYALSKYGENARTIFPQESTLSDKQVVEMAQNVLKNEFLLGEDELRGLLISTTLYKDEDLVYWAIVFRQNEPPFDSIYAVTINGLSGAVIDVIDYKLP